MQRMSASNLLVALEVAQSHIMQFTIPQLQHGFQAVDLLSIGSQIRLDPHLIVTLA